MSHSPSPIEAVRWLPIRNDAGLAIPAYAVLRPTGVISRGGQAVVTVARPDAAGGCLHLLSGQHPVPAGEFGLATLDTPWLARYDTTDIPAPGEQWGPAPNSWLLAKDRPGFTILGGAIADAEPRVMVVRGHCCDRWSCTNLEMCFTPTGSPGDDTPDVTGRYIAEDANLTPVGRGDSLIVGGESSWHFPGPSLGYLTLTDPDGNAALPLDTCGDFDFSFFYSPDALTTTRHELLSIGPLFGSAQFEVRINGSSDTNPNRFHVRVVDTTATETTVTDTSAAAAGESYHVRVGWRQASRQVTLQVDGGSPLTATTGGQGIQQQDSSVMLVGASVTFSGGVADGRLDGLRLWSRRLADWEVAAEHNGGAGRPCP